MHGLLHGSALVAAAASASLLLAAGAPQAALAAPAPLAGTALFNTLFGRASDDDDDDDEAASSTHAARRYSHKLKLSKYDPRWRHAKAHRTPAQLEAWALNERKRVIHRHHRHVRTSAAARHPRQEADEDADESDDDDDDDEAPHTTRSLDAALEARSTTTIGSQGLDQFYFAQVDMGTPAQPLNLYIDTGSADLWVIGSKCGGTYKKYCTQVPLFDAANSTSYKSDHGNESNYQTVSYVDGSGFSGWLGSDTVSFAGYTLPNLNFILVDDLESDPNQQPTSGLMGLSYQAESVSGSKPFLQTLADSKQFNMSANGFGLALTRQPRNKTTTTNGYDGTASGGIIDIGEIDPTSYSGALNWVDIPEAVQKDGSWAVPIGDVSVGGSSVAPDLARSRHNTAYIDSGTSLCYLPRETNQAIFDSIDGAEPLTGDMKGYYSMPCNAKPNVALTFGGVPYAINTLDLIAGALDDAGETCLAALSDSDGSGVDYLIGATFMKSYYIFFSFGTDGRGPQIGFANLPATGAPTTATGSGAYTPTTTVPSPTASVSGRRFGQNSYAATAAPAAAGTGGSIYDSAASAHAPAAAAAPLVAVLAAVAGAALLL